MSPVFAKFDFGNLIIILIFATPLIRAMIESARKSREAQQGPARSKSPKPEPPRRAGGGSVFEGKPMTWEDLMSGRGPEATPPKEPPPLPMTTPKPKPRPQPYLDPEVEFRDEWHEHEGPMVPQEILGRAASEDEMERHGGDFGRPLTEVAGEEFEELAPALLQGGLGGGELGIPAAATTAKTRARRQRGMGAGGWRRALVQAELLAGPIALRDVRAPGPFGSPPGLGGR